MDFRLVTVCCTFRSSSQFHLIALFVLLFILKQVNITDITVIEGQMGFTKDSTALTTTIGITLDGRNAVIVTIIALCGIFTRRLFQLTQKIRFRLIGADADDHISQTQDVVCGRTGDRKGFSCCVFTHTTLITTAIYITQSTTFHKDIRSGNEILYIVFVIHWTTPAAAVHILANLTTMQTDVGRSADNGFRTKSATITVTCHVGTLVDMDIGVGLLTQRILIHQITIQTSIQTSILSSSISIFFRQCLEDSSRLGFSLSCRFILFLVGIGGVIRCRLLVQHHTAITTAISLIHIGTIVQIDFRVLCPRVLTITGTKDTRCVTRFILTDRSIDIQPCIKGTAAVVVTAIDTACRLITIYYVIGAT